MEEQFLVDEELIPDSGSKNYFCLTKRLYDEYCTYLRKRCWKGTTPSTIMFGKRLSQFLRSGKTRSGRGFYLAKNIDQLHGEEGPAFDVVDGGEGRP